MKRLFLIAALVLIPWQALAVELDADSNGYQDLDKGGTNAATEQDPTVDTSAEIQAIIGAGVYEPSLDNPATTGFVLSSTDAGVRSWVAVPTAASLAVDDLITLSGVAEGAANLGAFTGSTIADNQTVKAAIQALETFAETLGGGVDFTAYDGVTWGTAAGGSQVHTFDTGAGTDPAFTVNDTDFTFNKPLVASGFTSNAADGEHYYEAINTAAITATATAGRVSYYNGFHSIADGTDWNDYLLNRERIDTLSEFETVLFVINTIRDIDATGAVTFTGQSATRAKTLSDAADTIVEKSGSYTDATGTYQTSGVVGGRLGEIIKTASATLTAYETNGTVISNYGETDDADLILTGNDVDTLPGHSFVYNIVAAMATNDTCFKAAADNLLNFEGTSGADNGCICNAAPSLGDKLTCYALTTGASAADWFCEGTRGTWAAVADNTGDCPD